MNSIENPKCTSTRPALALVATRTRKNVNRKSHGEKVVVAYAGEVCAVRLIPTQDSGSLKQLRRELIRIVAVGGGKWSKNWKIVECFA